MNPNTGAIASFETDEDAEAAGHTVKIAKGFIKQAMGMNRHDRRAWAAQQRRDARRAAKATTCSKN